MEQDESDQPEQGAQDAVDAADVVMRPPTLALGCLAAAAILELVWPLGPGLAQGSWKPVAIGLGFMALGLGFGWAAVRRFFEAGTTVQIHEPTETLVTSGLYRWSRNPIYIGLITVYFGLCLALTTVWGLLLLPVLVAVLHKGVVLREEAFLEGKFGDAYRAYKAKAPRWL